MPTPPPWSPQTRERYCGRSVSMAAAPITPEYVGRKGSKRRFPAAGSLAAVQPTVWTQIPAPAAQAYTRSSYWRNVHLASGSPLASCVHTPAVVIR